MISHPIVIPRGVKNESLMQSVYQLTLPLLVKGLAPRLYLSNTMRAPSVCMHKHNYVCMYV